MPVSLALSRLLLESGGIIEIYENQNRPRSVYFRKGHGSNAQLFINSAVESGRTARKGWRREEGEGEEKGIRHDDKRINRWTATETERANGKNRVRTSLTIDLLVNLVSFERGKRKAHAITSNALSRKSYWNMHRSYDAGLYRRLGILISEGFPSVARHICRNTYLPKSPTSIFSTARTYTCAEEEKKVSGERNRVTQMSLSKLHSSQAEEESSLTRQWRSEVQDSVNSENQAKCSRVNERSVNYQYKLIRFHTIWVTLIITPGRKGSTQMRREIRSVLCSCDRPFKRDFEFVHWQYGKFIKRFLYVRRWVLDWIW